MRTKTSAAKTAKSGDEIAAYGKAQRGEGQAICDCLHNEIRAGLPQAAPKIWHAMPVWFIGDNPVVGYKVTPKHVNLLFWNGQSFEEPGLQAAGKFRAAQVQFTETGQIDPKALRRWLKKAGKDIWNYAGLRAARTS